MYSVEQNDKKAPVLQMLKKGIYGAMQSNNVDCLIQITHQENNTELSKQDISNTLAEVYEDFRVANVLMSTEINAYVIDQLLKSHFIHNNDKCKRLIEIDKEGSERHKFVCKLGDELYENYFGLEGKDVDEEFVLKAKFLAKNINLLKRTKKYDLPWEQMEFLIVIFIASVTKLEKLDLFVCSLILDKDRLLSYLIKFIKELKIQKKHRDTKSEKTKDTDNAIYFEELYNDYIIIKDVYSLQQILHCIQDVKLVDSSLSEDGKLAFERALQTIGEYFKNSQDSPNLSEDIHQRLLASAPKDIKIIITKLRDCLSHSNSLINKIEMESEKGGELFDYVKNDLLKVEKKIEILMNRKKVSAIQIFLSKIIRCESIQEVQKLAEQLPDHSIDTNLNELTTKELHTIKLLINELDNMLQTLLFKKEQLPVISEINKIIKEHELETETVQITYINHALSLNSIFNIKNISTIKNAANYLYLKTVEKCLEPERLQLAANLLLENINNITTELNSLQSYKVMQHVHKIVHAIEYDVGRVKGIDGFKEDLNKEYSPDKDLKKKFLNNLFQFVKSNAKETHEKVENLLAILERKSEELNNLELGANFCQILHDLIPKPKQRNLLINEFKQNNFSKCKELLRRLDKYGPLVKNIKTTEHFSDCITYLEKASDILDTSNAIKLYRQLTKQYYTDRLAKLACIIRSDKFNLRAVEILVLELSELLENAGLFADHKHFLDSHFPLLLGKALRNYLAHGNLLVDILINADQAVLSNAIILVQQGTELIETEKKIGAYYRIDLYNHHLTIIMKQKKMLEAAKQGDLQKLKKCIEDGANILGRDVHGKNIVDFAIEFNRLDILKFGIGQGINTKDLILKVTAYGNTEMLMFLIDKNKEELKMRYCNGKTLLHVAAQYGHMQIISMLIEMKLTDVNITTTIDKWTPLHYAVDANCLAVVSELLKNGANVNQATKDGFTSLHLAAQTGCIDVIKLLLLHQAKVNAEGCDGWQPLHLAAYNGHHKAANILLQHGADLNAKTIMEDDILQIAIQQGHARFVSMLLDDWPVRVNCVTKLNETPLFIAVYMNFGDIVDLLLAHNVDVNVRRSSDNQTALHMAATNGSIDIIQKLLCKNADIVAKDNNGLTALHAAAYNGHSDAVQVLLHYSHNAIVDLKSNESITPLHFAAQNNHKEVLRVLISNGANVNAENDRNVTPLHIAAENGHEEACDILLTHGANVNAKSEHEKTALHYAVVKGNIKVLEVLYKHNADLMARNDSGYTVMHFAAQSVHGNIIGILVEMFKDVKGLNNNTRPNILGSVDGYQNTSEKLQEHGAGANITTKMSSAKSDIPVSPLYTAAENGQDEQCEALLVHGANPNWKNEDGEAALHVAVMNRHTKVIYVLHKYNADLMARTNHGYTAMHYAIYSGHNDVIEILVKMFVDVKSSHDNSTPIMLASKLGNKAIVEELLKYGADVNGKNTKQVTPLIAAADYGHKEVVELLLNKKANATAVNIEGCTALHFAALNGHDSVVKTLLANKNAAQGKTTDLINAIENRGYTPLHLAVEYNQKRVVRILVLNGADVNAATTDGKVVPLRLAVANGNKEICEILLASGADVMAKCVEGFTLIHAAAHGGNFSILEMLLEAWRAKDGDVQSAVNLQCIKGASPLHEAVCSGHKNIVETLLSCCADVNSKTINCVTPLHVAAKYGYHDIVEVLLHQGAEVNAKHEDMFVIENNKEIVLKGCSPLHYAATLGYKNIVIKLIQNGAIINATDNYGEMALHLATKNGNKEIVEILLEYGADINARRAKIDKEHKKTLEELSAQGVVLKIQNIYSATPLHIAAEYGYVDIVEILLAKGAHVNACNEENMMPLHFAVTNGNEIVVDLLIKSNTIVNYPDIRGYSGLHYAAVLGNKNIVVKLLKNSANLNNRNIYGESPLHSATKNVHKDIVEILLKEGADPNAKNVDKATPLYYALSKIKMENICDVTLNNCYDIMLLLLKSGADPNTEDKNGVTALYFATVHGYTKAVALLVQHHANITARILQTGLTALHVSVQLGHRDITYEMLNNGADVNCKGANGGTPLHCASQNGNVELMHALIQHGADANAITCVGVSSLHLAVLKKQPTAAQYLLELNDININSRTKNGETPLHLAVRTRQKQIVRMLMAHGADIWIKTIKGDTALSYATKIGCNDIIQILLETP